MNVALLYVRYIVNSEIFAWLLFRKFSISKLLATSWILECVLIQSIKLLVNISENLKFARKQIPKYSQKLSSLKYFRTYSTSS